MERVERPSASFVWAGTGTDVPLAPHRAPRSLIATLYACGLHLPACNLSSCFSMLSRSPSFSLFLSFFHWRFQSLWEPYKPCDLQIFSTFHNGRFLKPWIVCGVEAGSGVGYFLCYLGVPREVDELVSLLQLDRIWNLIPKANKPKPKKLHWVCCL